MFTRGQVFGSEEGSALFSSETRASGFYGVVKFVGYRLTTALLTVTY